MNVPVRERRRGQRYSYSPEDNLKGRFASFQFSRTKRTIHPTNIVDLSTSGLGFLLDSRHAPHIGERIGVEFQIPGEKRVAVFGYAVRLEAYNSYSNLVKVGVEFAELPLGYHRLIKQGIHTDEVPVSAIQTLQDTGTNLVVDIKSRTLSWKSLFFRGAILGLAMVGAAFFILQMSEISKTKWWVPQAFKFQYADEMEVVPDIPAPPKTK